MSLDGFPTLQALGAEFARIADAERAGLAVRRRPRRSLLLGIAIALGLAGSAAAGTLLLLRGSVIPAPQKIDVGAVQFVVPDSIRLADQRAADPDGGAPWGLQLSRSETGLVCSTVGQVVGERFGLVGLDGRFRVYEPGVVDGCGAEQENATTLLGARVFDAD
ncbi:MAG: hypothetical protein JWM73_1405, partial [Solirubrobacterales bacterium]|nr:hypothetical protein [Solirubrobacterales bacterium]